jgi:hypothetical protein
MAKIAIVSKEIFEKIFTGFLWKIFDIDRKPQYRV